MVVHHKHTHTPAHLICPLLLGRPQWGLCCFLSCQLSHGCQQLLLRIRYAHILDTHTNIHSLSAWNTGSRFTLCPYIPFRVSSWFTTTETGELVPHEESLMDGLKEGDKKNHGHNQQHQGDKNKSCVSLVSSINTLLYVCACTSDQMCTII